MWLKLTQAFPQVGSIQGVHSAVPARMSMGQYVIGHLHHIQTCSFHAEPEGVGRTYFLHDWEDCCFLEIPILPESCEGWPNFSTRLCWEVLMSKDGVHLSRFSSESISCCVLQSLPQSRWGEGHYGDAPGTHLSQLLCPWLFLSLWHWASPCD